MTWTLDYWCTRCDERYSVTYDHISVGPVGMEQITGIEELESGLRKVDTKPLYDGKVVRVSCPACHFVCDVCVELTPVTMSWFVGYARQEWPNYKISNMFSQNSCWFADFPIHCPACDFEIKAEAETKRCRNCNSDQINVVGGQSSGTRIPNP